MDKNHENTDSKKPEEVKQKETPVVTPECDLKKVLKPEVLDL